jgi:predicted nucleic acid-binding protein
VRILVDTNVLIRHIQPDHPQQKPAQTALSLLRLGGHQLEVVPQVLYELWVACTRPVANNGMGFSLEEIRAAVADVKSMFRMLRDERAIYDRWEQLVIEHDVKGKSAHDARLVAAMMRHGLSHLLTFNAADFARYPITVLTPQAVAVLPPSTE